ncbi:MAG: DedA family protein [Patescibacteria group bacterium]|nr:DedA family protein [Patescibacteria group bacterium]
MHPTILIHNLIDFLYTFKYFVLFISTIIEGPIIMIASGFLIHTGFLDLFPSFIAIMFGDLVGDVVWYGIGYYFAGPVLEKHGHFMSITPQLFEKSKELFHKYHTKILLISKVTMGFGMALAILVAAGATKVSFKKYMFLNTAGEILFVSWMLAIGYFFGHVYVSVPPSLKIAFIVFWIIFIIIFIKKSSKYMKNKITNN